MAKENENKSLQLLSAKELAGKLLLSARTVWRLRSARKLPNPVHVGSSIRWKLSDIQLYLDCDCDMERFEAMKQEGLN